MKKISLEKIDEKALYRVVQIEELPHLYRLHRKVCLIKMLFRPLKNTKQPQKQRKSFLKSRDIVYGFHYKSDFQPFNHHNPRNAPRCRFIYNHTLFSPKIPTFALA